MKSKLINALLTSHPSALSPQIVHTNAMSGLLKRKFEEVDEDPCYSSPSSLSSACSGWDSEGESCYSDTLDSNPSNPSSPATNFNSEYALPATAKHRKDEQLVLFNVCPSLAFTAQRRL